jgi:hypothetical protein
VPERERERERESPPKALPRHNNQEQAEDPTTSPIDDDFSKAPFVWSPPLTHLSLSLLNEEYSHWNLVFCLSTNGVWSYQGIWFFLQHMGSTTQVLS